MHPATLQELRAIPLFAKLSAAQARCFEPGTIVALAAGQVLMNDGDPVDAFYVLLEGELRVSRNYSNQAILMGIVKPGMFLGEISLLLDSPTFSTIRAIKACRLLRLGKDDFWLMLSACPAVASEIFRTMATRVRNVEGYSQQREKLASLGTMAAGLAHELNNPATAARRAAAHLRQVIDDLHSIACDLHRRLTPAQWAPLIDATQSALATVGKAMPLDSVTRSDREEQLAPWLEQHGIADGWKLAPALVTAALTAQDLQALAEKLPGDSLGGAVRWLEARLSVNSLLHEMDGSTTRIAELVKAVKSYSHLDQSPLQEVDVHEGLESTLTMLGHKLKNCTVTRQYDPSLPRILAYGGELNQVWTNLIDNAIDAVQRSGKIRIATYRDDDQVVVEIADNGSGIPPDVQSHIFEPFYTTKGVGSGTGLGLVISNRIVADRHGGEIEFQSEPGDTRFIVRLPIKPARPAVTDAMVETRAALGRTEP